MILDFVEIEMKMLNFNSFGIEGVHKHTTYMSKFQKSTQILQGNVMFSGKIHTAGKEIYTTAGRDKFQVCTKYKISKTDHIFSLLPHCAPKGRVAFTCGNGKRHKDTKIH